MIMNVHKDPEGKRVIALCDESILGKKIEEGDLQLDLTSRFYQGTEKSEDLVLQEVRKGTCHLNVVGKDSVDFCLKKGFIDKNNIIMISGVPHVQAVVILED